MAEINRILLLFIGFVIAWSAVSACLIQSSLPTPLWIIIVVMAELMRRDLDRLWELKRKDFQ